MFLSWVFSDELSSSESRGHSVYNPDQSSTAQQLEGASWSISYGDGSTASGDVYTDDVTVGGVTVTGQAVELASTISTQFQQDTQSDGLLGLAFSSINEGQLRCDGQLQSDTNTVQSRPIHKQLSSTPPSTKASSPPTSSPPTSKRVPPAHMTSASSTPASILVPSHTSMSTTPTASGNSLVPATPSARPASNPPALMPSPTPALHCC